MSFANKHNKAQNPFTYKLPDENNHVFVKPSELYEMEGNDNGFVVKSMYINNKGNYKPHGVLICENPEILIDCPEYMTDDIRQIMASEDDVISINGGKVGVRAYPYQNARGTFYGLEWVDIA